MLSHGTCKQVCDEARDNRDLQTAISCTFNDFIDDKNESFFVENSPIIFSP